MVLKIKDVVNVVGVVKNNIFLEIGVVKNNIFLEKGNIKTGKNILELSKKLRGSLILNIYKIYKVGPKRNVKVKCIKMRNKEVKNI